MKRLVILFLALSVVIVASGILYAGGNESPHVRIHEVLKVSGSSKNVEVSNEGLDVKEETRQLYNRYSSEEIVTSLYPKFDDKAWADIKYRSLLPTERRSVFEKIGFESRMIYIVPNGKMAAKPIPKNAVPSAKTGLMNPRNPVKVMTLSNKLTLDFDSVQLGTYPTRLLDSKGRELGSVKANRWNAKGDEKIEVTLPDGAADYYVELKDDDGRRVRYCYILLNIEPDPVKPSEDPRVTRTLAKFSASMAEGEQKMHNYMDRHGITDVEQLTEDDMITMTKENMASAPKESRQQVLSSIEIMQKYMKDHNIASMSDLTEKDEAAIQKLMIKNSVSSWPAAFRAAVDKYMKQHKISKYEDLTPEELEAIGQQFERQSTKSRKKTR